MRKGAQDPASCPRCLQIYLVQACDTSQTLARSTTPASRWSCARSVQLLVKTSLAATNAGRQIPSKEDLHSSGHTMPRQELHTSSKPLTSLVVHPYAGPLSPRLSENGKVKPVQSAIVHMTEQRVGNECKRRHSSIGSSDTPSRTGQDASVSLSRSSGPVKPAPCESDGLTQTVARWSVQMANVTSSSSGLENPSSSIAHSTAHPQSPQPGVVAAAPPARRTAHQHRDGSFGSGASGRSETGSHESGQVGSSPNYTASTCSYGRQRRYRLEIVSLPAYCATSGVGLCSPTLIVRLHVEPTSPRVAGEGSASETDSRHVSAGSMAQEDVPYLISNVSVWSSDGSMQLMPVPATGAAAGSAIGNTSGPLMRGRLVVPGQLLKDTDGHENVYFIFPSLQLTRPGQWRLGVSLFGLWPGGSAIQDRRRSSQSSNADASTGSLLATVVASAPTTAYDEEDVAGLEEAALAVSQSPGHHDIEVLMEEFRQQGVDLSASELSSEGSEGGL